MKLGEGSVSRCVGPGSRGGQERGPRLGSLLSQAVGPTIDYLKSSGLVDICQPVSAGQFPRLKWQVPVDDHLDAVNPVLPVALEVPFRDGRLPQATLIRCPGHDLVP